MSDELYPGDSQRLSVTFSVSTVNTDPTTVTLIVQKPDGTQTTYTYALAEVTKDGTGLYHKDVTLDTSGPWAWRWVGTGTVVAADEGQLVVRRSFLA